MTDDKACDRNGCDNIYCNRYSKVYGYLCYQCFHELEATPDVSISNFMKSVAKVQSRDGLWEDYLDDVFKLGND